MFPQRTHIIVVDDSYNIREILADGLRRLGYKNISSTNSAVLAWAKIKECSTGPNPVQLILSDLNMPEISGMDFLRRIRASKKYSSMPFMMITTEGERGSVVEAAVSGVSGYIIKPFNVDILQKQIMEAWKKHGEEYFTSGKASPKISLEKSKKSKSEKKLKTN